MDTIIRVSTHQRIGTITCVSGHWNTSFIHSKLCVVDQTGAVRAWVQDTPDPEGDAAIAEAIEERLLFAPLDPKHIIDYVVSMGSIHEDDCPKDRTCACKHRPVNDTMNELCRRLQERISHA